MKKYFIFLTIFLSGICSWASLHFPLSYKDTITENKQEAFIFHDGKNAHLIIRTNLSAKQLPAEIAWVLPFPSLPTKYEEFDGKIFEELYDLLVRQERTEKLPLLADAPRIEKYPNSLKIHKAVIVGNYKIQPIEITKDNSATEFNSWLSKNHFSPMPFENQKYYLKKGAVFLAIRMETTGLHKIEMKPLHVVYPSNKVSVPIKFSQDQGTFDIDIYVFSEVNLSIKAGGWESGKKTYPSPSIAQAYLYLFGQGPYSKTANPILGTLLGNRKGFITRFVAGYLNHPTRPIKKIASDPNFLAFELSLPK